MNQVEIVDVIIPSLSKPQLQVMIRECIESLRNSEESIRFNIILVESFSRTADLGQDITIQFDLNEFNFHRAIKLGLKASTSRWVVLANNDLIFHPGWMSKILEAKQQNTHVSSFSPWDPKTHPAKFTNHRSLHLGYEIGRELAGWCLITTRDVLDKIKLTEEVAFWYSDNTYADELQRYNLLHALVSNSHVTHLCSQTLIRSPNRRWLTQQQESKYNLYKQRSLDVTP